jgi:hypothetical protein
MLSDVLIVPDLWVNILSLTKVLKSDKVKLGNQGTLITLNIGSKIIPFDREFGNRSGRLLAVEIAPQAGNEVGMVS